MSAVQVRPFNFPFIPFPSFSLSSSQKQFNRTYHISYLGGVCDFIEPRTTLKGEHCRGGACTLEGKQHPNRIRGGLSF
jgi:hypothetical protein